MNSPTIFLQTVHLEKSFGTVQALKDLNITNPDPEIIGLIGPNGAGKTTFIRLLLGLLRPSTGSVTLFGHDCWHESDLVRQCVGFTHTSPKYPSGITLQEYLYWVSNVYSIPRKVTTERIIALSTFFDMQSAMNRFVNTFSSGMEVKTGLIQAFLPSPKTIILDEPTANLDPLARLSLMKLIQGLFSKQQTSFLISSHSLHELEQICSYYIFLDSGTILWLGKASDLGNKSLADFYLEAIQ